MSNNRAKGNLTSGVPAHRRVIVVCARACSHVPRRYLNFLVLQTEDGGGVTSLSADRPIQQGGARRGRTLHAAAEHTEQRPRLKTNRDNFTGRGDGEGGHNNNSNNAAPPADPGADVTACPLGAAGRKRRTDATTSSTTAVRALGLCLERWGTCPH